MLLMSNHVPDARALAARHSLAEMEEVADLVVGGEKAPHPMCWLEARHLPFSSSHRLA